MKGRLSGNISITNCLASSFMFNHPANLSSASHALGSALEYRLTVDKTRKNSLPRAACGTQTPRAWLQF